MATLRVVVTRPIDEANPWGLALREAGHDPVELPLIEIRAPEELANIQAIWKKLEDFSAIMFVSKNAVFHFFSARPIDTRGRRVELPEVRAWVTGPGTRAALVKGGWPAAQIDSPPDDAAQFDSETLWEIVRSQTLKGKKILFVRGESRGQLERLDEWVDLAKHRRDTEPTGSVGRDWLAESVRKAGATPVFCISYWRCVPEWTTDQIRLARQSVGDSSVWLFSSSEAIDNLGVLLPHTDWADARAVVTHPRILARAKKCGFGRVELTRPTIRDVVASIELQA